MTLLDRIRELLSASPEPLSVDAMWCALDSGRNKQQIRAAVGQLMTKGEIVSLWKSGRCFYEILEKADARRRTKSRSGSGVIAGPITIGRGMKWGAGL